MQFCGETPGLRQEFCLRVHKNFFMPLAAKASSQKDKRFFEFTE